MNPLGALPAGTSRRFRLDAIDYAKLARFALVQAAGLFLTAVPGLLGCTYTYHDTDYTPFVLIGINTLAEATRRFLSDQSTPQSPTTGHGPQATSRL